MIQIRRSDERGHANHGWLVSYHTFSFAGYHDPRHMGYRSLRVINDDRVQGGQGFGRHPQRDFEIISYVLSGALKHEDSMGHEALIRTGEVQHISAGTGIEHSEFNNSSVEPVHFLQIWLLPHRKGLAPSYDQKSFSEAPPSALTLACAADGRSGSIKINQDVDLYLGRLDPGEIVAHPLGEGRHAWVQVIEGDINLNDALLSPSDGVSVDFENELKFSSSKGSHFLLFDLN